MSIIRHMKTMEELLQDFGQEYQLDKKYMDMSAVEAYTSLQEKDSFFFDIRMRGVHQGVLFLETKSPTQRFAVMMKKSFVIHYINTTVGSSALKEIRFVGKHS